MSANDAMSTHQKIVKQVEEKSGVVNKVEEKPAVGEQGLRQKTKTKSDLFTKDDEEPKYAFSHFYNVTHGDECTTNHHIMDKGQEPYPSATKYMQVIKCISGNSNDSRWPRAEPNQCCSSNETSLRPLWYQFIDPGGMDGSMLRNFDFYHGFLPREDLPSLLKQVGDYLLRVSEVNNDSTIIQRDIILSILTEYNADKSGEGRSFMGDVKTGKLKNLVIKRQGSMYQIESNRAFDTLRELIEFYKTNTGQLNMFTFLLKNPIKLQSWEYLHSDVKEGVLLGKGAFGEVRAGTLQLKTGESIEVAIKITKCSSDLCKAKIKEMMREARLMRNFNHKNIVRIYGVAVDKQPLYILLELVSGGSLQSFLKANAGKIDVRDKIRMCLEAAQGVAYLHSQRCMHRDLAARNCLITNDRVVKVSDFGLSLIGTTYVIRTRTKLPIKWLAPETISTFTFSLKTDVFSFGVMAYEIFSDGAEPWEGKTNAEVKVAVTNGECVQMPSCCPELLRCFIATRIFANNPEMRAEMIEVVETFQRAYSESRTFRMRRKIKSFMQDVSRLS
ncbi:hypothetical protein KIN20_026504 [Parelaphostrongylus tenuis]|uniref:Tyrosine-protein kinase n=1 Tax=Parelaphostrongylus tenuis TaxID=148309 RepID=A0AAD5QY45_PARTN|nr:hypothetical protein KIN20_026504 [Parelaphostrongylus tenuis]